jgi:hypothetical protein
MTIADVFILTMFKAYANNGSMSNNKKSVKYGNELSTYLMGLDAVELRYIKAQLEIYVLSQRVSNYGYERCDFQRIQRQRAKAKKMLTKASKALLASSIAHETPMAGMLSNAIRESRLSYDSMSSEWSYTVGQSANEEITNLIARLSGSDTCIS